MSVSRSRARRTRRSSPSRASRLTGHREASPRAPRTPGLPAGAQRVIRGPPRPICPGPTGTVHRRAYAPRVNRAGQVARPAHAEGATEGTLLVTRAPRAYWRVPVIPGVPRASAGLPRGPPDNNTGPGRVKGGQVDSFSPPLPLPTARPPAHVARPVPGNAQQTAGAPRQGPCQSPRRRDDAAVGTWGHPGSSGPWRGV